MAKNLSYFDFHCHLDAREFDASRNELINGCWAAGFSRLVTVADPHRPESVAKTAEICALHPAVRVVTAAHPHQADAYTEEVEKTILDLAGRLPVIAVGEAGLDFHYNFATRPNQERVFRRQIALARELRLPLVIHSRLAEAEVLAILDQEQFTGPVVFHCYTGSLESAQEICSRGYLISVSGIVTFKKAVDLQEVARSIPESHLLVETDSPYLSPEPYRGQTNTPLRIPLILEKVAFLRGLTAAELALRVEENYRAVFGED